jgi:TRAP-type C4-dicarboxylate transport system substrate-binding protein
MHAITNCSFARLILGAGAVVSSLALMPCVAGAQDKASGVGTYVMKISTPTINDIPDTFARNYGAALEKDSGGRIKVEVYPASQLGSIPRQIEGTQFGSIQCEAVPPEFMVGLDQLFEVMAAPGLVDSQEDGQRVAADPAVRKLMLGLGADKGLHGTALFMAETSIVVTRKPIRTLADFKGKKLRIFASKFQSEAFERLGVTPVAMTLGDVLPAIQQGTIDGAVTGMGPVAHMHFVDAAKYVTMTNQPSIFIIVEVNKKWYDSLPNDLQQLVDKDATEQSVAINPIAIGIRKQSEASYTASGGELIKLPTDEQISMMKTLASVGADVSKSNPQLAAAYKIVTDAASRSRKAPSQ